MKLTSAIAIFMLSTLAAQPSNYGFQRCGQKPEADCYYVVEDAAGLKEFEFFWIGEVKGSAKPLSIRGRAYVNKVFIDLTGKVEHDRLSFVTGRSRGFTYKFAGRFIPGGKAVGDGEIHVQGDLIKLEGSRKIVSGKVKFFIGMGRNT